MMRITDHTTQSVRQESRKTSETDITCSFKIRGQGKYVLDTEIPFFEHMLSHIAKHGNMDIELRLRGDIGIDCHHSVEDTGILLGKMLRESIGDKKGICRYGHFTLPMDEVLTTVSLDLGGRFHFKYTGPTLSGKFGIYDAELTLEFLEKFAMYAGMNLHVLVHYGSNAHHIHESIFKAFGKSLRMAVSFDPEASGIPSTKGMLE